MFEQPKGHTFGGSPNDLMFCLNIRKLELTRDFSLEKLVTIACKRNYFVLQTRDCKILPVGQSAKWNVSM